MNTIQSQWVHALLSGKYTQGHCYLRSNDDLFSVLGVLADLAVQKQIGQWQQNSFLSQLNTGTKKHPYRFVLPENQMTDRDYGHAVFFLPHRILNSCDLSFGRALYLMQRNDQGWSFAQLAEEIASGFSQETSVQLTHPAALAVC